MAQGEGLHPEVALAHSPDFIHFAPSAILVGAQSTIALGIHSVGKRVKFKSLNNVFVLQLYLFGAIALFLVTFMYVISYLE